MFENVIATAAVLTLDAHAKISILFLLVSSLGADPFTGVSTNEKPRKIDTLTN